MAPNQLKALQLLKALTRDRFDIWMLAGSSNARLRAALMSELTGSKVPQSKSGVNAIRDAFYAVGNISGDCLYEQENNFIAWARQQTA